MKKLLVALVTAGVVLTGIAAYAQMHGGGQGYGPGMMWGGGQGCGPGMMWGGGPGMHMWGYSTEEGRKFLDETVALRGKLNEKMFEYMEAWRTGDKKKAEALWKEMEKLRETLYAKAKKMGIGEGFPHGGYGPGGVR